MITAEYAMRKLLCDNAAVAALVKNRIYPQAAPQGAESPYAVYRRIPGTDHHHHMLAASGLVKVPVRLEAVSPNYSEVKELADAQRKALDGFMDDVAIGSDTLEWVRILLTDESDGYIPPANASDAGKHVIQQDYDIWHAESVPAFS